MDHDRELGFCPSCGGDVKGGESFCRNCGRSLQDVDPRRQPVRSRRPRWAFIILVVTGIFLLWMGVGTLMDPQPVIDEVMLQLDGMGFDEAFAETFVMFYGYSLVATALMALAAGAMAYARRYWVVAVILTLLVALSTPFFIFSFPAFLALYLLWKGREDFA